MTDPKKPDTGEPLIDLLREARDELLWWINEHGCCAGHEGDLIDRIDASLASQVPLTEEQIEDLCSAVGFTSWSEWDGGEFQAMWTQLVRAVEAHHGITPSATAPRS